ncbi:MAG TPA: hypothetical protein VG962_09080 [Steroidobacteraceae bacterium]|nr:hypothetical protein [Steroidobacteraceae bacterium]
MAINSTSSKLNMFTRFKYWRLLSIGVLGMMLAACGGNDGGSPPPVSSSSSSMVSSSASSSSSSSVSSSSSSSSITLQQRTDAATQTAQNNSQCTAIQPFYWEIGDHSSMLAGATAGNNATSPDATTEMLIASASKWIFGAYVLQLHQGNLTANDLAALTMNAGYTNFTYGSCIKLLRSSQDAETVHECFTAASSNGGNNNDHDANADGKYFYNGGQFQWLADTDLGLGADNNSALHDAVAAQLGSGFNFTYDSPQLAAGIKTSAQDYAFFLREILNDQLLMHDALGTHAVCTNPLTCNTALSTPIPSNESWHYSIAHWVEDDPLVGDGTFSSPGAFGFYPWIDASKTYYGILARYNIISVTGDTVGVDSVQCGRLIRKAWMTGVMQ